MRSRLLKLMLIPLASIVLAGCCEVAKGPFELRTGPYVKRVAGFLDDPQWRERECTGSCPRERCEMVCSGVLAGGGSIVLEIDGCEFTWLDPPEDPTDEYELTDVFCTGVDERPDVCGPQLLLLASSSGTSEGSGTSGSASTTSGVTTSEPGSTTGTPATGTGSGTSTETETETGTAPLDGGPLCDRYDTDCGVVPDGMVCVPAGFFEMGSLVEPEEQPVRQVCMPTFYIDETEVTVAAYGACVSAGECEVPDSSDDRANWARSGREQHPVNYVDWHDAVAYCTWAEARLPTEAEWEKAARGPDARTYPWGEEDATCERVVMWDVGAAELGCGNGSTMPVGSKSPAGDSPYGVMDLSGNVQEFCSDRWADQHDPTETDNPGGPADGISAVVRGGGWAYFVTTLFRAATRISDVRGARYPDLGFRCARSR